MALRDAFTWRSRQNPDVLILGHPLDQHITMLILWRQEGGARRWVRSPIFCPRHIP